MGTVPPRGYESNASDFAQTAQSFCALLSNLADIPEAQRSIELTGQLAGLLAVAERLPKHVETDDDDIDIPLSKPPVFDHGTYDMYYEVFDPFVEDELVIGSLTDDLGDIYVDLAEGLDYHRLGRHADALWSWRLSFDTHWGDHLVDALRALRRINSGRGRNIVAGPPGPIAP